MFVRDPQYKQPRPTETHSITGTHSTNCLDPQHYWDPQYKLSHRSRPTVQIAVFSFSRDQSDQCRSNPPTHRRRGGMHGMCARVRTDSRGWTRAHAPMPIGERCAPRVRAAPLPNDALAPHCTLPTRAAHTAWHTSAWHAMHGMCACLRIHARVRVRTRTRAWHGPPRACM